MAFAASGRLEGSVRKRFQGLTKIQMNTAAMIRPVRCMMWIYGLAPAKPP